MTIQSFIACLSSIIFLSSLHTSAQGLSDFIPDGRYITLNNAMVFTNTDGSLQRDSTVFARIDLGSKRFNIEIFKKNSIEKVWAVYLSGVQFKLGSIDKRNRYAFELVNLKQNGSVYVGIEKDVSKAYDIKTIYISYDVARHGVYHFYWDAIFSMLIN